MIGDVQCSGLRQRSEPSMDNGVLFTNEIDTRLERQRPLSRHANIVRSGGEPERGFEGCFSSVDSIDRDGCTGGRILNVDRPDGRLKLCNFTLCERTIRRRKVRKIPEQLLEHVERLVVTTHLSQANRRVFRIPFAREELA
ncbi:MAG: hypothetical protein ABI551_19740 [Polyangiaceae bacterium]